MRNKTAVRRLSLAVIAALPAVVLPGVAQAQFRANNQDGRALDANNRVGSGGYNERRDIEQPSGNQIVTGNVTAGRQFRGPVPYSDPNEFAGPTGTDSTDRFIRGSSGAPEYSTQVDMTQPRPFYGNRTITPPPGYVQTPSGTYAPAPLVNDATAGHPPVGIVNNPTMSGPPMPGEMILPGPGTDASSILTASPLYGIRQWDINNPNDAFFLSNYTSMGNQAGRGPLDAQTLERYRQELRNSANPDQENQNTTPAQLLPQTPENQAMDNSVNRGQIGSNQALTNNVGTDQSLRNRLLTPPTQQSAQYAEMHNRYDRFKNEETKTDAEYNREYQAQLRQKKAQEEAQANQTGQPQRPNQPNQSGLLNPPNQPGQPGQPGQAATPGRPTTPQQPATPENKEENKEAQANPGQPAKPEPIKVDTLANGVQAKGLADTLRKAEALMKEGKFASALDQYDIAQQIAPNNPLIVLGRAHAELGAGYYARAETHIREAVTQDPAILVGQYDLRVFIGTDRLQEVIKELKNISVNEPKQTTPVFLLAYIAYNTDNERQAAAWLDLAEKRAGRTDGVYRAMREIWKLPTADTQPAEPQTGEMNK